MMKSTRTVLLAMATCMLLAVPHAAQADGDWRDAWNAYYADVCPTLTQAANACTLCHIGIPAPLNPYGNEMADMNFASIEGIDSDGDGYNNGQEINVDCTLPGDADSSVPVPTDTWGAVKALFR